jgi:hypothetical protein
MITRPQMLAIAVVALLLALALGVFRARTEDLSHECGPPAPAANIEIDWSANNRALGCSGH